MLQRIFDFRYTSLLLFLAIGGYSVSQMLGWRQTNFLPDQTSAGHYQIELACESCHTPFGGVTQQACLDCHEKELEEANDSHDVSIFDDPRYLVMLEKVDATQCIVCHQEHEPEHTTKVGVTLPEDFCIACHQEVGEERPSHEGMAFNSCADSGCHNFHDNRALYEDFLAEHLNEVDLSVSPLVVARNFPEIYALQQTTLPDILTAGSHDGPSNSDRLIIHDWENSGHAQSGVNCTDCHGTTNWVNNPPLSVCEDCHNQEYAGMLAGRHGMRLAAGLSPMTPEMARIPMKEEAHTTELTCNTCHSAHAYDTQQAAVDACLECHNDEHSKAYTASPHSLLWQKEVAGEVPPNSGVSCATCHLPRVVQEQGDMELVWVQHNQNDNLRPNSKMIRSVCLECHGLEFTLNALADPALLLNNYSTPPSPHLETLDMIESRLTE